MSKDLEQRVKRLPQWAQWYISKLQRDDATLCAERGKIADGDAKITFWVEFGEVYGIPDRATVQFWLGDDIIDLSLHDSAVRVHSSHHRLTIKPAASNAVSLSVQR